ncbi:MAG: hypothetical protein K8T25_09245 [Planctomycetia bacterium]|nr:hypothetical protein [Planctomycetia bacterium]
MFVIRQSTFANLKYRTETQSGERTRRRNIDPMQGLLEDAREANLFEGLTPPPPVPEEAPVTEPKAESGKREERVQAVVQAGDRRREAGGRRPKIRIRKRALRRAKAVGNPPPMQAAAGGGAGVAPPTTHDSPVNKPGDVKPGDVKPGDIDPRSVQSNSSVHSNSGEPCGTDSPNESSVAPHSNLMRRAVLHVATELLSRMAGSRRNDSATPAEAQSVESNAVDSKPVERFEHSTPIAPPPTVEHEGSPLGRLQSILSLAQATPGRPPPPR